MSQTLGDPNVIDDALKAQKARELAEANAAGVQGTPAVSSAAPNKKKRNVPLTGAALLAAVADPSATDKPTFEMVNVDFGENELEYYIRLLTRREENELLADAPRIAGVITVLSSTQEDEAIDALAIARCVYINASEFEEDEPFYLPAFSFSEVYGQQEIKDSKQKIVQERIIGMFEASDMAKKAFGKLLLNCVYRVNPGISPELKKVSKQILGEMFLAQQQLNNQAR